MHANIPLIIAGQSGSGKTLLLAALVRALQEQHHPLNLLVVERSHEIPLIQRAFRWEETNSEEGTGSLPYLAEKATQLGLEWLVLGECTGGEAYHVIKAFGQGTPVLTTLHATSVADAFSKLATLGVEAMSNPRMLPLLLANLSDSGAVAIHMALRQRESGLLGQVMGIGVMVGSQGDLPVVTELWRWNEMAGTLDFNPGSLSLLSPVFIRQIERSGQQLPLPSIPADKGRKRKGETTWR